MNRRESLLVLAGVLSIPGCSAQPRSQTIYVGSTNEAQNQTIAEVYAASLEAARLPVRRSMNIGDSATARKAILNGEIDLYPDYGEAPPDAARQNAQLTWLDPAPANDTACLVTSEVTAEQYSLLTIAACAALAPQLRFAADANFLSQGTFARLRHAYGGLRFKQILPFDDGGQYDALNRGDADIANAFNTDARIAEARLIVLKDERRFWQPRHLSPLISSATLHAHPHVRPVLHRVSAALTDYAVRGLNIRLTLLSMDPRDVALDFVRRLK